MLKKITGIGCAIAMANVTGNVMGSAAAAQSISIPGGSDIKVKPRHAPDIPRGPQLDPKFTERLNIRNVGFTFNTEGTVIIGGVRCVRTFLLFPVIEMLRPVSGKASIAERDVGFIGRTSFTAAQASRNGRFYIVQPTIRFTPDWKRIGPGYQFSLEIRVDNPAGTNWRTTNANLYAPCEPVGRDRGR